MTTMRLFCKSTGLLLFGLILVQASFSQDPLRFKNQTDSLKNLSVEAGKYLN